MCSDKTIIQVANVSKCFEVYEHPQDRLRQFIMPQIRTRLGLDEASYHREFWALRHVSFEIGKGQTVGIIGQNGSGKSTLLQIITGTMTPTSGSVLTEGRVAALLELGSGFNPEFTGRENVYMNASLLGLNRKQTDEKFDYIASFADIGDHLDQPVKTYSSGMMLRLAFAVQIAVETEILIIDEALAVGDARFQLKCFRRLEELKANGTTILFVSHAIELVRSFCDFGLVLDKGEPVFWGGAKEATVTYFQILFPENKSPDIEIDDAPSSLQYVSKNLSPLNPNEKSNYSRVIEPPYSGDCFGSGGAQLDRLKIFGLTQPNLIINEEQLTVRCEFSWDLEFVKSLILKDNYESNIGISIAIADIKGNYIFGCNGFDNDFLVNAVQIGHDCVDFTFKWPCLAEGSYFMTVAIPLGTQKHHIQLKWYDYLFEIACLKSEKNVFGQLGINYEMSRPQDDQAINWQER